MASKTDKCKRCMHESTMAYASSECNRCSCESRFTVMPKYDVEIVELQIRRIRLHAESSEDAKTRALRVAESANQSNGKGAGWSSHLGYMDRSLWKVIKLGDG